MMKLILNRPEIDVNKLDNDGETALHIASINGKINHFIKNKKENFILLKKIYQSDLS